MNLDDIIQQTKTYFCLDCGKCTSLCPIAWYDPSYSPRAVMGAALLGFQDEVVKNAKLFSCLTCGTCSLRCPSDVNFPMFVRQMRALARSTGLGGQCAHAGVLQSIVRMQAYSSLPQRRLKWLDRRQYRTSTTGDILLFVGCSPFFEPTFEDMNVRSLDLAEASLRILNTLGIEPVVHSAEKCCGHDALWMGDEETFLALARHNADIIKESGAKTVVCFCPECCLTLAREYPSHVDMDVRIVHISELLAEHIEGGSLSLGPLEGRVTYQDPCRLGRHLGVYDAPRAILAAIDGLELIEMPRNREDAVCCGTSCFTNCDSYSRMVRVERLLEARDTGAKTLVTACPKCQTHFTCALTTRAEQHGPDVSIEVRDLMSLVADALTPAV